MVHDLKAYLREITRYPLLSAEGERDLARRSKRNDRSARAQLITSNLRLVVMFARNYAFRQRDLSDLIQEGNTALIRAVDKYDPEREPPVRFSSYASVAIIHEMGNFSLLQGYIGRIPRGLLSVRNDIHRVINYIKDEEGEIPTPERVLERLEMIKGSKCKDYSVKGIKRLIELFTNYDHFFDPDNALDTDKHGSVSPYTELARDDYATVDDMKIEGIVMRGLDNLDKRTQYVLKRYYGLCGKNSCPLTKIGNSLGLTRERVRQIRNNGLALLRDFILKN